jgi:hypothetical protein
MIAYVVAILTPSLDFFVHFNHGTVHNTMDIMLGTHFIKFLHIVNEYEKNVLISHLLKVLNNPTLKRQHKFLKLC